MRLRHDPVFIARRAGIAVLLVAAWLYVTLFLISPSEVTSPAATACFWGTFILQVIGGLLCMTRSPEKNEEGQ